MTAGEPPWTDPAVAVERLADGEGDIVAEGTLREVTWAVTRLPNPIRARVRISLPDRGAPPFSYAGDALIDLIALLPTDDARPSAPRRLTLRPA